MYRATHCEGAVPTRLHPSPEHVQVRWRHQEDWLNDYVMAVAIIGGNRRVAVHYVPLMLQESVRTWLKSPPKISVNSWLTARKFLSGTSPTTTSALAGHNS